MKQTIVALLTFAAASVMLGGCAKHATAANPGAASTGPITDSGDTGLRPKAGATVAIGDAQHGAAIFSQNCASCHGAQGGGGGIGPRLKGEKQRKNYQQAITWIENPQPPMPKLYPAPLSQSDVNDVAAYVETL